MQNKRERKLALFQIGYDIKNVNKLNNILMNMKHDSFTRLSAQNDADTPFHAYNSVSTKQGLLAAGFSSPEM
jgi:hypothetical protein